MTSKINMANESEWKTYVPPNKRNRRKAKEEKMDANNLQDFPELGSKKPETHSNECKLNFALLINKDETTKNNDDVAPGFVRITRNRQTGKSVIENNEDTTSLSKKHQHVNDFIQASGLSYTQEQKLEALVLRWQLYRDTMDTNYGDGSPFYGMKRLTDPLSDDDYESDTESESSEEEYELLSEEEY